MDTYRNKFYLLLAAVIAIGFGFIHVLLFWLIIVASLGTYLRLHTGKDSNLVSLKQSDYEFKKFYIADYRLFKDLEKVRSEFWRDDFDSNIKNFFWYYIKGTIFVSLLTGIIVFVYILLAVGSGVSDKIELFKGFFSGEKELTLLLDAKNKVIESHVSGFFQLVKSRPFNIDLILNGFLFTVLAWLIVIATDKLRISMINLIDAHKHFLNNKNNTH